MLKVVSLILALGFLVFVIFPIGMNLQREMNATLIGDALSTIPDTYTGHNGTTVSGFRDFQTAIADNIFLIMFGIGALYLSWLIIKHFKEKGGDDRFK